MSSSSPKPSLMIVAGTYDGVLAGWEHAQDNDSSPSLQLSFATPLHQGSIRCLGMASSPNTPGTLVSCGYDEELKIHSLSKKMHSSGQVKIPSDDFGTPSCCAFCPPTQSPTHFLLGLSSGKLVVYKKRDWSIAHVLAGHDGGISSIAVHASGKLALTGGTRDAKLKLWDLERGRLSYVTKLPSSKRKEPIDCIEWSNNDGSMYGWTCGNRVTVRATDSGKDLLDTQLPSRVNQFCFMEGPQGIFVAAACNDGSLPVLAVQAISDDEQQERRAILAIEPVDRAVAGQERFKCICNLDGYTVVTANSAGVVSIMNLEGAIDMMLEDSTSSDQEADNDEDHDQGRGEPSDQDENGDEDSEEEEELAVDIIESVQLGSGARITCLAAWYNAEQVGPTQEVLEESPAMDSKEANDKQAQLNDQKGTKRKPEEVEMDSATVEKARSLVKQAKKIKKKKDRKKKRAAKD